MRTYKTEVCQSILPIFFRFILLWQETYHKKLWSIAEPDIDGMGAKPPSHDHVFSIFFKLTGTVRMEKLILRCHHAAYKGQADGPSVEMAGQCQICAPVRILLKIKRRMCQENLKTRSIRRTQMPFQICLLYTSPSPRD